MTEPVLKVRDLTVDFPGTPDRVPVVRGVSFDVHANEVLCIVGESGSGKSVTALAITGLLPASARVGGAVRVKDTDVIGADAEVLRRMRGRDVGFVFQDPSTTLNPVLPVGRQMTEGQVALGLLAKRDAAARAVELLREVDVANPEGRVGQYPHEFSGGMRQRAVIGMAMAGRPGLIIADEPTTALDVTVQAQVLGVLAKRQKDTGAAVVLITHDLGVVAEVADRVAVMYGGRIVETGQVDQIFAQPRHPYTAALLHSIPRMDMTDRRLDPIPGQPPSPASLPKGCAFEPRCSVGNGRPKCLSEDPALRIVDDASASACHYWRDTPTAAAPAEVREISRNVPDQPPLLEIRDLKVHFPVRRGILQRVTGHVRAVEGVNLTVHAGETVSLVGESGCGKTTTGKAVMGLTRATAGDILLNQQSILGLSASGMRNARRNMQYIFQDPFSSLNPVKTVEDIVAEPLHIHGLYDEAGGAKRIAELFDMVGLSPSMFGRYPAEFSGGQKQRIGIARALVLQPRLLILDEPVAALDVSIQAQILNLLEDLQKELNLGYLFIAHNLSVVRHISDRVAVMYLGRIVEESDRDTLYDAPVHPYTQSLMSAAPIPDPVEGRRRQRIVLEGEVPDPAAPPPGCAFAPRCFRATEICRSAPPPFERYGKTESRAACYHAGPLEQVEQKATGT
ncbi:ABC transporter ATP-binding protein [Oceaniovalibus sp. ACAM 378]|uniref:ABC transporter ATP-binding protein n=1 Tax=Oceaniovalibus sp. ACAM 378 TaxID=2599923 RepID=UPI0011D5DBF0|nr:ABC transporter ATP-binding protein [Oceaniovalibus sp. ACAM 378]TYB90096.1 ABC transporter ATP-binding protein [Oceaniovalibus sp. ACAM 378]